MFQLKDISLQCQRLGCGGIYDWISMSGCYQCDKCGLENYGKPSRTVTTHDAQIVYRLQQVTDSRLMKHGSSTRSVGRKRRKKPYNPYTDKARGSGDHYET